MDAPQTQTPETPVQGNQEQPQQESSSIEAPVETPAVAESQAPRSIVFTVNEQVEMLRIAPDGFYVRGVLVPRDANEPFVVYNAFVEFLIKNGQLQRVPAPGTTPAPAPTPPQAG